MPSEKIAIVTAGGSGMVFTSVKTLHFRRTRWFQGMRRDANQKRRHEHRRG